MRQVSTLVRAAGITLLVVAMLGLSGCPRIEDHSKSLKLSDTVKLYVKAVRWGDYELASRLFRNKDGATPVIDLSKYEGIRVTRESHEVRAANPSASEATMRAVFEYHLDSSARIRKVVQTLDWWYDEESETWFAAGTLPKF